MWPRGVDAPTLAALACRGDFLMSRSIHRPVRRRSRLGSGLYPGVAVVLASLAGGCVDGVGFVDESELGGRPGNSQAGSPSEGDDSGSGGETSDDESEGGARSTGGRAPTGGANAPSGGDGVGVGGEGPDPGSGGTPDPGVNGKPGGALVSLGAKMASSNYTLILTIGETPGGNGFLSSTNYRLRTGLIATTEGY
jgi:hypothetical protein